MAIELKLEQKSLEWLNARKGAVGSSEVSCILGTNPFKSSLQLWEEKTGRRESQFTKQAQRAKLMQQHCQ